jgi:hypothetical protein
MAARSFHCEIVNKGTAPIVWVDDKIESGDWVDDHVPSETAKTINPGETGHYQAESDGDIPLIGNVMTGTEGWSLFSTTVADGPTEYIKINHNLPYWAPPNNWHPVWSAASRYDPRIQPGAAEFDTRDMTDPQIRVHKANEQVDTGNFLTEFQSLPWIVFWGFASWGGINVFGKFHCHIKLVVSGSAPPPSTKIPLFDDTPAPAPVPKPFRFSSPNLWTGVWEGQAVTVVISASPSGLLDVVVTERLPNHAEYTYEARNLAISRIYASKLGDVRHAVLAGLDEETRFSMFTALERKESSRGYLFEVQRLAGDERFGSVFISADHPHHRAYGEVAARFIDAGGWRSEEMGGDFLSLPGDATLEIHRLVAGGRTIGYSLRYRRPSSGPLLFMANAASAIDEMLYYRVVLR